MPASRWACRASRSAERAYQQSLDYAKDRLQGRAIGATETSAIIDFPDVRRMLMTQKAYIAALRRMMLLNAVNVDISTHHPDAATRARADEIVGLLTPICKSFGTDLGNELTSLALQIHGGMGFIEETGAAQHYRDVRIAAIYEGTNGIQAADLIGRKLPVRNGASFLEFIASMRELDGELAAAGEEFASHPFAVERAARHARADDEVDAPHRRHRPELGAQRLHPVPAHLGARGRRLADGQVGARRTRPRRRWHRRGPAAAGPVLRRAAAARRRPALVGAVTAGSRDLYALDADALADRAPSRARVCHHPSRGCRDASRGIRSVTPRERIRAGEWRYDDSAARDDVQPPQYGQPPVWGGDAIDGPGWSGLLAWTGLLLGAGSLLFAIFAPIGVRGPTGILWIAMFGALAIGAGVPGAARHRRLGGGDLGVAVGWIGAAFGAIAMLLMIYAYFAVLLMGGEGLPVLPAWEAPNAPPPDDVITAHA